MGEEKVLETAVQTPADDQAIDTSDKKVEEHKQPFKSFESEEDYNKVLQSERSKAKYQILKDLGLENVEEFKSMKKTFDESAAKTSELEAKVKDLQTDLELEKIGLSEGKKEEFLALAKLKDGTGQKTLTQVSEELRKEYPQLFRKDNPGVSIGTDKGDPKPMNIYGDELVKKYPWLA